MLLHVSARKLPSSVLVFGSSFFDPYRIILLHKELFKVL